MNDKAVVYKSNIQILYSDLCKAINEYVDFSHCTGEVKYINAYVMAVLGAIAAYKDTVIPGESETDEIKACKYANNMLKHDPTIISNITSAGGMQFPMTFPLVIPEIEIVWKWQDLNAHHLDQKEAFRHLFAGKPVINTLERVLAQLDIQTQQ